MRQENIQKIIQQRQPLAVQVMRVRDKLSSVVSSFEKFQLLCRTTFQDKELAKEFGGVIHMLDNADTIKSDASKRLDELKHIQQRLTRNTLNIAVIGRARQGKSRLLQTITGLKAEEIPDGDGEFCTGVRSDIINEDTDVTYARVNFMTEEKFIREKVAPYFSELSDIFSIVPTSVSEFENITIPAPDSDPKNATAVNQHLKHLAELQSNLPKYKDLLDERPKQIKKEDIRSYVAQDDENGNRIYFNHLAVDSVEIFCRFPNDDLGALRLIDLPGLGDTKIGDVSRVVNALKDQVDLVLFLTKPSNAGASWDDVSTDLYSKARSALGEKLPIQRWAFWVFNHDSRTGADNEKQCKILQDTIRDSQIRVADTVIVDCTNKDEVFRNLIDAALSHLSANIELNDREYADNLQNMLKATIHDMTAFAEGIRSLLKDDSDFDKDSDTFNMLFEELWDNLREAIQDSVDVDSQLRMKRNEPYTELKTEIKEVLDEERTQEIPLTEEDIKRASRGVGGILTAYQDALHYLRTRLSGRLQKKLDEILETRLNQMKNELCGIMLTKGKLGERFKVFDETHNYELLGQMIDYIETSGNSEKMPTLLTGLRLLNDWTMSYRSFIQHRMRGALNGLDPRDDECLDNGTPKNAAQAIELLGQLYRETTDKVEQALEGIYTEPNKAVFAVAEEFKDIMIRSSVIRANSDKEEKHGHKFKYDLKIQWSRFYRPIRGYVWPEEYESSQRIRNVNLKLQTPLDNLLSLLKDSDFVFLH